MHVIDVREEDMWGGESPPTDQSCNRKKSKIKNKEKAKKNNKEGEEAVREGENSEKIRSEGEGS